MRTAELRKCPQWTRGWDRVFALNKLVHGRMEVKFIFPNQACDSPKMEGDNTSEMSWTVTSRCQNGGSKAMGERKEDLRLDLGCQKGFQLAV